MLSTIKRDYVRVSSRPNAESVMCQLPSWIAHYNEVQPEGHWKSRSAGYALAQHSSLPKASRDPLNVLFALERLAASMGGE
jgi:hypothetical protein